MDPFIFMMHCILNTPNPQVFALHGQCIALSCKLAVLQIALNLNSNLPYQLNPHQIISPLNTYQYVSAASSSISTKVDCCMLRFVCSWILSSAEMKICTRSLLMYVDVWLSYEAAQFDSVYGR